MRRALAAVVAAGILAVLAAAALDTRERAFAVGLPAVRAAGVAERGRPVCREGIDVPVAFARVRLVVGTFGRPGPPLAITVAGRTARVPGGYRDGEVQAQVGAVAAGGRVRVCVAPDAPGRVAVFGVPPDTPGDELQRPDRPARMAVVFLRERPARMTALVPEAFRRAARFNPAGAWTYWVLLGAVGLGVPAALARAAAAASSSSSAASRDS